MRAFMKYFEIRVIKTLSKNAFASLFRSSTMTENLAQASASGGS